MPDNEIYIPFRADLYGEIVLRNGRVADVPKAALSLIEEVIESFLDRTFGSAYSWSEKHVGDAKKQEKKRADEQEIADANAKKFPWGDPLKGYQWLTLFLPNSTILRMRFKGKYYGLLVDHEELIYWDVSSDSDDAWKSVFLSPSDFVCKITGTNRNAWRDLYIKFPGEKDWQQADVIRKQGGRTR